MCLFRRYTRYVCRSTRFPVPLPPLAAGSQIVASYFGNSMRSAGGGMHENLQSLLVFQHKIAQNRAGEIGRLLLYTISTKNNLYVSIKKKHCSVTKTSSKIFNSYPSSKYRTLKLGEKCILQILSAYHKRQQPDLRRCVFLYLWSPTVFSSKQEQCCFSIHKSLNISDRETSTR